MQNKRGDRMTNGGRGRESVCYLSYSEDCTDQHSWRGLGCTLGRWRCFVFGLVNQCVNCTRPGLIQQGTLLFFCLSLFLLLTFLSLTLFAAASPHSPPPDFHSSTMPTLPHTLYLQLKTLSVCPLENCTYCVEDSVEVRSLSRAD